MLYADNITILANSVSKQYLIGTAELMIIAEFISVILEIILIKTTTED